MSFLRNCANFNRRGTCLNHNSTENPLMPMASANRSTAVRLAHVRIASRLDRT